MGVKPGEFEAEALSTVHSLLSHWNTTYLSPSAKSPLPPIEWKYYANCKGTEVAGGGEGKQVVHRARFLTTWSQPTLTEPVPRATANVWVDVEGRGQGSALTYRFEHHHLSHTVPVGEGNAPPPFPPGHPARRLPDLITSKLQVSDAMVRSRLLDHRSWREWAVDDGILDTQHGDGSGSSRASRDTLHSRPDSKHKSDTGLFREQDSLLEGEALSSPWTQAAMAARKDMVREAVRLREAERSDDDDHDDNYRQAHSQAGNTGLANTTTTTGRRGRRHPPIPPRDVPRPIIASTVMERDYLSGPGDVAVIPPLPEDWAKFETRTIDPAILHAEREARKDRRLQRELARAAEVEMAARVAREAEEQRLALEALAVSDAAAAAAAHARSRDELNGGGLGPRSSSATGSRSRTPSAFGSNMVLGERTSLLRQTSLRTSEGLSNSPGGASSTHRRSSSGLSNSNTSLPVASTDPAADPHPPQQQQPSLTPLPPSPPSDPAGTHPQNGSSTRPASYIPPAPMSPDKRKSLTTSDLLAAASMAMAMSSTTSSNSSLNGVSPRGSRRGSRRDVSSARGSRLNLEIGPNEEDEVADGDSTSQVPGHEEAAAQLVVPAAALEAPSSEDVSEDVQDIDAAAESVDVAGPESEPVDGDVSDEISRGEEATVSADAAEYENGDADLAVEENIAAEAEDEPAVVEPDE
ncbi:hypothetical protein DFS34DRAFT_251617 [Phlyctochytrium arcticum]|nr:hypothetical protein DFS34DRAFT_251617 [Phlyctochytrium arcticum]